MPIDTVLVALTSERNDRLADVALDLAEQTGATAVIGTAYDEETHSVGRENLDIAAPDDLARRDEDVAAVASRFEDADIPYEVRGTVDRDGAGYVSLAEQEDADRVIVHEQKRSPAGKAVFGSVAQHVLLNAPCPVTFVGQ